MFIQENEFGLDLYDNYIKWVSLLPTTHLHTLNIIRDLIKCNHLLITFLNHSYDWIVTVSTLDDKNKILDDNYISHGNPFGTEDGTFWGNFSIPF